MNRGQLESVLNKPKIAFRGKEQYPELYQKAAVLMEAICKTHVLVDGNKRASMAIAEFMVSVNGGYLVIPLKAVRLIVDAAMDEGDLMHEEIQAWFKIHTANNAVQLRSMLEEMVEEDDLGKLMGQGRYSEAGKLVDKWVAFESYPEYKRQWSETVKAWEQEDNKIRSGRYAGWRAILGVMSTESVHHQGARTGAAENLTHVGHSLEESRAHESRIMEREAELSNNTNVSDLWDGVAIFEKFALHERAIECLDSLSRIDRDGDHILYHRMNNLFGMGKYEQCLKIGEDLLEKKCNVYGTLLTLCLAYYELKRYDEALGMLDRMPEKNKRQHVVERGMVLSKIDRIKEAEKCFESAYIQDPDDLNNMLNKAIMLASHKQFAESIRVYDMMLRRAPNNADLLYNKGLVLCETGDWDKGLECYHNALKIRPKYVECIVNIGAHLSDSGDWQESMRYFEMALEINPVHSICLLNVGVTLNKMQKCSEAIKYLERLHGMEPGNVRCSCELAAAYAADGHAAESMKLLEKLLGDPTCAKIVRQDSRFGLLLDSAKLRASPEKRAADG